MEWSNTKYFFAISEAFRDELENDRNSLKNEYPSSDEEYQKSVCHTCDDCESCTEREGAHIPHEDSCWSDIEPEKGNECSDDNETECCENEESFRVCNHRIDCITEEEKSPCKTIKSISDIDTISSRYKDEDKKRNIEVPDLHASKKWNMERCIIEFEIEPICPNESEEDKENHLDPSGESLGSPDATNIQIIIDESDTSDTDESKKCNIGFMAIPEAISEACTKILFHPRTKILNDNSKYRNNKYCQDNEDSPHGWRSSFSLMESSKFFCFSNQCFFTYLFSHFILLKNSDPEWHDEKGNATRKYE